MNTEAVTELVNRWNAPGGIPFKGALISEDGCMCAQGQALHYIGGMTADELRKIDQRDADTRTMKLLGISRFHAILLRGVNDGQPGAPSVVLTDPEKVMGDQAQTVLAFGRHMDRMTGVQWDATRDAARTATRDAARTAAWDAAGDAARTAAGAAAAGAAAWDAARTAAAKAAAGAAEHAVAEIMGAKALRERGIPFTFLPMFGFADPEAVLAAGKEQA